MAFWEYWVQIRKLFVTFCFSPTIGLSIILKLVDSCYFLEEKGTSSTCCFNRWMCLGHTAGHAIKCWCASISPSSCKIRCNGRCLLCVPGTPISQSRDHYPYFQMRRTELRRAWVSCPAKACLRCRRWCHSNYFSYKYFTAMAFKFAARPHHLPSLTLAVSHRVLLAPPVLLTWYRLRFSCLVFSPPLWLLCPVSCPLYIIGFFSLKYLSNFILPSSLFR